MNLVLADLERAVALVQEADGLIVAAGAGMGVDSGLPDFRGQAGFWRAYPALRQAGLDFTDIASPAAFVRDPGLAWGFYGHRLNLYRQTVPHAGFALLQGWGEGMADRYSVFTSNVDGQFQKAGYDPLRIHECHGSIHHLQCLAACSDAIWPADDFWPEVDADNCRLMNTPPHCPRCGGLARPNILMFDDWQWLERRSHAQSLRQQRWLANVRRPLVIELGAGSTVPSVRHFSAGVVYRHGGRLIRINPDEHGVANAADVGLACTAAAGLRAIGERLAG